MLPAFLMTHFKYLGDNGNGYLPRRFAAEFKSYGRVHPRIFFGMKPLFIEQSENNRHLMPAAYHAYVGGFGPERGLKAFPVQHMPPGDYNNACPAIRAKRFDSLVRRLYDYFRSMRKSFPVGEFDPFV